LVGGAEEENWRTALNFEICMMKILKMKMNSDFEFG